MPDLLDTNVLSELPKSRPDQNVLAYIASQPREQLFISIITIAEIRYGILNAQEERRKQQLEAWLEDDVRTAFQGRLLPVTEAILIRWRALMEQGRRSGRTYSEPDLLLAATALEHDLSLVTRNVKDFRSIPGLQLVNPWELQS